MSKQKRDVWCDHCDYRFSEKADGDEAVVSCPNCGEPTILVCCSVCENESELAHVNFQRSNWICPQCKEYRDFSAEILTDFLAAQISMDKPEPVRRRWRRPSFRVGCVALIIIYVIANIALSSCGDLLFWEREFAGELERVAQEYNLTEEVRVARATQIAQEFSQVSSDAEFIEATQSMKDLLSEQGELYFLTDKNRQVHALPFSSAQASPVHEICGTHVMAFAIHPALTRKACQDGLSIEVSHGPTEITGRYSEVGFSENSPNFLYTLPDTVGVWHFDPERDITIPVSTDQAVDLRLSRYGNEAIYVDVDTGEINLWRLTAEGALFSSAAVEGRAPALSPDHAWIAYICGSEEIGNLCIHNRADDETTTVVRGVRSRDPSWTLDGQWVIFSANFDGDFDIYAIQPFGSQIPVRLYNTDVDESQPVLRDKY